MDDVVVNKIAIIERCLHRIEEEYSGMEENLLNYTKQDSIILNLQRACEASIDLAMHIIAIKKLGVPQVSREAFEALNKNDILDEKTATQLKAMVGFRNIAVHDYQKINLDILKRILDVHLDDFRSYAKVMSQFSVRDES